MDIRKVLPKVLMGSLVVSAFGALSVHAANPESVPGEIIVKFKGSQRFLKERSVYGALKSLGAEALVSAHDFATDSSLQWVKIADPKKLNEAISRLRVQDGIEYAEPNYVMKALDLPAENGIPNDPDFSKLWGMNNAAHPGVDINVLPAWSQGMVGSRDVKVAIIDTGVDYTHVDLKNNIAINAGEVAGDGIDNDGNGFIDDVIGMNFVDPKKPTSDPMDDHYHGTHCAGTVGGEGNNQTGVAGVVWKTSIIPVKFLSASGSGSLAGAVESIKYATLRGANIMSNSWGGGGFSQSLLDAITAAKDKGILFIAAAGNDAADNDADPHYPSNYQVDNVISVAAIDSNDKLASFSNFGKQTVHVAAPGVDIWSTTPKNTYKSLSGTSMATPHVSGIASLMLSVDPSLTFADVKERLIKTSTPVVGLKKRSVSKGRVNVWDAINNTRPAPEPEPDPAAWKFVEKKTETPHPYQVSKTYTYSFQHPGAKFIRVRFSLIDTEAKYDLVTVKSGTDVVEVISGKKSAYTSEYAAGGNLTVTLTSDSSEVGQGFVIEGIEVIE